MLFHPQLNTETASEVRFRNNLGELGSWWAFFWQVGTLVSQENGEIVSLYAKQNTPLDPPGNNSQALFFTIS